MQDLKVFCEDGDPKGAPRNLVNGHGNRPRVNSEEDKQTEYDNDSLAEWNADTIEMESTIFQKSLSSTRVNKIGLITLNQHSSRRFHNVYTENDKEELL